MASGSSTTSGAGEMASSLFSSGHDIAQIAQAWIVDGLMCGIGALVAVKVDEAVN